MQVGQRYSSPWGEYTVRQLEPLVLVAGVSAIVDPGAATLAYLKLCDRNGEKATPRARRVGSTRRVTLSPPAGGGGVAGSTPADHTESGGLPVAVDSRNETGNRTEAVRSADGGGAPSLQRTEIVSGWLREMPPTDALSTPHQRTLGAYRSAMSCASSPAVELRVWTPCLVQYRDPSMHTGASHVYFLSSLGGSIFCPEHRLERPHWQLWRDGAVVFDNHADARAAMWDHFSPEVGHALCASGSDEEFSSPELSPTVAARSPAVGSGVESSTPELLAMAVAREDIPPVSDAKATSTLTHDVAPPLSLPYAMPPKCTQCGRSPCVCKLPPIGRPWLALWEWQEWCAERAAIVEFDANMPRANAERRVRVMAGAPPR